MSVPAINLTPHTQSSWVGLQPHTTHKATEAEWGFSYLSKYLVFLWSKFTHSKCSICKCPTVPTVNMLSPLTTQKCRTHYVTASSNKDFSHIGLSFTPNDRPSWYQTDWYMKGVGSWSCFLFLCCFQDVIISHGGEQDKSAGTHFFFISRYNSLKCSLICFECIWALGCNVCSMARWVM